MRGYGSRNSGILARELRTESLLEGSVFIGVGELAAKLGCAYLVMFIGGGGLIAGE